MTPLLRNLNLNFSYQHLNPIQCHYPNLFCRLHPPSLKVHIYLGTTFGIPCFLLTGQDFLHFYANVYVWSHTYISGRLQLSHKPCRLPILGFLITTYKKFTEKGESHLRHQSWVTKTQTVTAEDLPVHHESLFLRSL